MAAEIKKIQSTADGDITAIPTSLIPDEDITLETIINTETRDLETNQYSVSKTNFYKLFTTIYLKIWRSLGVLPKILFKDVTDEENVVVYQEFSNEPNAQVPSSLLSLNNIKTYVDGGFQKSVTYDLIIRTQGQFNAMINSPDWLGARSIAIIGLKNSYYNANGSGVITFPKNVKNIDGFGDCTIITSRGFKSYNYSGVQSVSNITILCDINARYNINLLDGFNGVYNCSVYIYGGRGFYNCKNVNNCRGDFITSQNFTSQIIYFFDACWNINNFEIDSSSMMPTNSSEAVYVFIGCKEVNNAKIKLFVGTNGNTYNGSIVGAYNCDYMNNIHIDINGASNTTYRFSSLKCIENCGYISNGYFLLGYIFTDGYVIYNSKYLSNIYAFTFNIIAVKSCTQVSNVTAVVNENTSSRTDAFDGCTYLSGCSGYSKGGSLFFGCKNVSSSGASLTCKNSVFSNTLSIGNSCNQGNP